MAGNYALNHWDPVSVLPSYSQATYWDGVDSNSCIRWNGYRVDCVVSVSASNYYYDPVAEMMTGYAYCVGTVKVTKNQRSGRISVSAPGFDPFGGDCDSTNDTTQSY
jgi:hypothetical protein